MSQNVPRFTILHCYHNAFSCVAVVVAKLLTLCLPDNYCCLRFFSKSTFSKYSFRNIFRVSNSLDPDQARRFVGPGLDPDSLQILSADDTI